MVAAAVTGRVLTPVPFRVLQSAAENRRMQIPVSETAGLMEVIYCKNSTIIYSMPKPTSMLQRPRNEAVVQTLSDVGKSVSRSIYSLDIFLL